MYVLEMFVGNHPVVDYFPVTSQSGLFLLRHSNLQIKYWPFLFIYFTLLSSVCSCGTSKKQVSAWLHAPGVTLSHVTHGWVMSPWSVSKRLLWTTDHPSSSKATLKSSQQPLWCSWWLSVIAVLRHKGVLRDRAAKLLQPTLIEPDIISSAQVDWPQCGVCVGF